MKMKKSTSAPNLTISPLIKTQAVSPIQIPQKNKVACQSIYNVFQDINLANDLQVVTRSPMHHVAHCLASEDTYPKGIEFISKELATCLATPFEEINDELSQYPLKHSPKMSTSQQIDRAAELLMRIRRGRSKKD
jgi:hypothetical protein